MEILSILRFYIRAAVGAIAEAFVGLFGQPVEFDLSSVKRPAQASNVKHFVSFGRFLWDWRTDQMRLFWGPWHSVTRNSEGDFPLPAAPGAGWIYTRFKFEAEGTFEILAQMSGAITEEVQ